MKTDFINRKLNNRCRIGWKAYCRHVWMPALLLVFFCLASLGVTNRVDAAADSQDDRMEAALRYMEVVPLRSMFDEMLDSIVKSGQLPIEGNVFLAEFFERLDIEKLEAVYATLLVKHFSVEELNAFSDFYASDVGKSVMKKLGPFTADVMPLIQGETQRILIEIVQDTMAAQKRQKPAP